MAATVSLALDQGTNFTRLLTFKDDANVAIDLTGYTFRGQAKLTYTKTEAAFTFAFALRNQSGADRGKVDMSLDDSQTTALVLAKATAYVYDVEMVDPAGNVTRIFQGTVTVSPEVTK